MVKTAQFNSLASNVAQHYDYDIVTLSFDAPASRGIMEFFANARRNHLGQVDISVTPLHKPSAMILRLRGTKPVGQPAAMGYGFSVDQVGQDGRSVGGLMPLDAFTSVGDGSGSDPDAPKMSAMSVETQIDSNSRGEPLLTFRLAFARPQINA